MFKYYMHTMRHYAVFSGRARRREFILFWPVVLLFTIPLVIASALLLPEGQLRMVVPGAFILAHAIPSLVLKIRRLHDMNCSGWWYFIFWLPFIGFLLLWGLVIVDGTVGENRFGPDPKNRMERTKADKVWTGILSAILVLLIAMGIGAGFFFNDIHLRGEQRIAMLRGSYDVYKAEGSIQNQCEAARRIVSLLRAAPTPTPDQLASLMNWQNTAARDCVTVRTPSVQ